MSSVEIRVEESDWLLPGELLWSEILDSGMKPVRSAVLRVGERREAQLDEGRYFFRAETPRGAALFEEFELGPEKVSLSLRQGPPLRKPVSFDPFNFVIADPFRGLWARPWVAEKGGWSPGDAFEIVGVQRGARSVWLQLKAPSRPCMLQFGSSVIAAQSVALFPADGLVSVGVGARRLEGSRVEASADVFYEDAPELNALLDFISRGRLAAARSLVVGRRGLAERVMDSIHNKRRDSLTAAGAAYCLLRTGWSPEHSKWLDLVPEAFPELPDGPVIAAWSRLRAGAPGSAARELLLEAAARELPVFSEGLRRLYEGLRLVDADAARSKRADEGVAHALDRVGRAAAACDWGLPWRTVLGADPNAPSRKAAVLKSVDSKWLVSLPPVEPQPLPPESAAGA